MKAYEYSLSSSIIDYLFTIDTLLPKNQPTLTSRLIQEIVVNNTERLKIKTD